MRSGPRRETNITECYIWPGTHVEGSVESEDKTLVAGSHRAGGKYAISSKSGWLIGATLKRLGDQVRARLTTMLIEMRRQGVEWPELTTKLIKQAEQSPGLSVAERSDRLLVFLGKNTLVIGRSVRFQTDNAREGYTTMMGILAISESVEIEEVVFLIANLKRAGFVDFCTIDNGRKPGYDAVVTAAGYARIAELSSRTDSAQAFMAMWFHDSMSRVYDDAFARAIEDAGYRPFRIDRHDYAGKIDDEVIAQIRRSRFLVADFTHERRETVRGSVYYEAGFAHGLNIPVIFTARKGSDVHFDVEHYNRIEWDMDNLPKLRDALKNRILAIAELGPGPDYTGD